MTGDTTLPKWCFIDNKLQINNITILIFPNTFYETDIPALSSCNLETTYPQSDWLNPLFYRYNEKQIEYKPEPCDVEDLLLSEDELLSNGYVIPYIKEEEESEEDNKIKPHKRKYKEYSKESSSTSSTTTDINNNNPNQPLIYYLDENNPSTSQLGIYGTSDYHISTFHCEDKNCKCIKNYITLSPCKNNNKEKENVIEIFSLDCEMVMTTKGLEVARLSIIDAINNDKVVYDEYILPQHPVIDYLTNYSGITEEKIKTKCKTNFYEMRMKLLELWNDQTILIGHSLDNDLRVLRICHNRIIDTAILYQLNNNYNNNMMKLSLKYLTKIYFDIDIQNNNNNNNISEGHDSIEDALSCIRLVKLKVKYGKKYNILNNSIKGYNGKPLCSILKENNKRSYFILPIDVMNIHSKRLLLCDVSVCRNCNNDINQRIIKNMKKKNDYHNLIVGYYPNDYNNDGNDKNEINKFLDSLDTVEANINSFFIFILPKVSEKDEIGRIMFKFINKNK